MLEIRPGEDPAAHCYRHEQACPALVYQSGGRTVMVKVNIAGVNCYDWSTMGLLKQWLGSGTKVFLCWLRERYFAQEEIVVVECVWLFDFEGMEELTQDLYSWVVLDLSPVNLGLPISRRRKYMVGLHKRARQWHPAFLREGSVQQAFQRLLHRQVVMKGQDMLRASPQYLQRHSMYVAATRGLPPSRPCGKPWRDFQLMKRGARCRILQYEKERKAQGLTRKADVIIDSAQTVGFTGVSNSSTCPALLQSSRCWSMNKQRFPVPEELFELQGHDVLGQGKLFCPFGHKLRMLRDASLRKLAGNGMHLACIEATLLLALACSVSVPPVPVDA